MILDIHLLIWAFAFSSYSFYLKMKGIFLLLVQHVLHNPGGQVWDLEEDVYWSFSNTTSELFIVNILFYNYFCFVAFLLFYVMFAILPLKLTICLRKINSIITSSQKNKFWRLFLKCWGLISPYIFTYNIVNYREVLVVPTQKYKFMEKKNYPDLQQSG